MKYTLHLTFRADSDADALAVAAAQQVLLSDEVEPHVTDAEDWAEVVSLRCGYEGQPMRYRLRRNRPTVIVEVDDCYGELRSMGTGRRVCGAHRRAYEEARRQHDSLWD